MTSSTSPTTSPATYGLLGLLATRSWTGYELTQQVQRSLRFTWPTSEGHLYREQKRLVTLGWATATTERVGRRSRKRYTITDEGREALRAWLETEPEEPHFQIEGLLRVFFADRGTPEQLVAAMLATGDMAGSMVDELRGFVDEYLADGGPLWMLEQGVGGPQGERLEFRGRPMYPERLHVVALAIDLLTRLLSTLDEFLAEAAEEAGRWPTTTHTSLTPATRRRLEAVRERTSE
ncbi:MAG: PadR family transcriptional regulator [Nitriliruptorales bacterium]|nr:PadR family transcriptional regulator [Nitriliruptorales bacterium]